MLLFSFLTVSAQDFRLTGLFRPRLTFGYEDVPPMALNDSINFRNNEFSFGATLPLRINVSVKKLRPKLKMDFLLLNGGYRQTWFEGLEPRHSLFRGSFGISGVRAGIGTGAWIYTVNGGISADLTEPDKNFPYLTAAFGRIFIKGVKRQNLYGMGLFLGRGSILPFPVIGINRLYSTRNGLIALIPLYVQYWHNLGDRVSFSGRFSLGGFNNAWTPGNTSSLPSAGLNPVTLRVFHARTGVRFDIKTLPQIVVYVEGGADYAKLVRFAQEDEIIYRDFIPVQPYGRAGITWKIPRKETKWYIPEF